MPGRSSACGRARRRACRHRDDHRDRPGEAPAPRRRRRPARRTPPAEPTGHAIAVHLHAEDAERHLPLAAGRVALLRLPGGPGIRVDRGVAEGDSRHAPTAVPGIATLTAWGRDRDEAVVRLRRALDRDRRGGRGRRHEPRRPARPVVAHVGRRGDGGARRPPTRGARPCWWPRSTATTASSMAAHASFFAWSRRGRPQAASDMSRRVELRHRGSRYVLDVSRIGPIRYRVRLGDAHVDVDLRRTGRFESRMAIAGRDVPCRVVDQRARTTTSRSTARAHLFVRDDGSIVRAPDAGRRRVGVASRPATNSMWATRWRSSRA